MGTGKHQQLFDTVVKGIRGPADLRGATIPAKLLMITNDTVDLVLFGQARRYRDLHAASRLRNGEHNGIFDTHEYAGAPDAVRQLWSSIHDLDNAVEDTDAVAAQAALDSLVVYCSRLTERARQARQGPMEMLKALVDHYEQKTNIKNGRNYVMSLNARQRADPKWRPSVKQVKVLESITREQGLR
jgi:hypothetical protein